MPTFFRNPRTALLLLLENLQLGATSQDARLLKAVGFIAENKTSRFQSLPVLREGTGLDGSSQQVPALDLSFVLDDWWEMVTGHKKRSAVATHIDRRYLEMCVLHQAFEQLQAGDLCIQLMPRIRDWKEQKFFRASPEEKYEHIGDLFKGNVDWHLIQRGVPPALPGWQ